MESSKETTLDEKRVVLDLRRCGTNKGDRAVREQREIWRMGGRWGEVESKKPAESSTRRG